MLGHQSIITLAVITICVAKRLLDWINTRARRHSLIERHQCKLASTYPQLDKYLGVTFVYHNVKNFQARTFLQSWENYLRITGNTFTFWVLGQRMLVTSDPENMKTILSSSFDDFELGPRRRAGLGAIIGDGMFASDGEQWHQSRVLLRPSFAKSEMNDTSLFERHFGDFVANLPEDGKEVDLDRGLRRLTMNIATGLLFGADPEELEVEKFSAACEVALRAGFRDVTLGILGRMLDRQAARARTYVHGTVDRYVKRVLDKNAQDLTEAGLRSKPEARQRYVFLENLSERTKDPKVLRDQSLSALLGATETTSSLLSNLIYDLARRPDLWTKLRAEALKLKDQRLDQETMKSAVLLSHCINESLRLNSVVPINVRYCNKDTILPHGGGSDLSRPILVLEGTQIYMAVWHMHRDKTLFGDDADEFKPERWENLKPGWSFAPFGGGPRLCIGQQLALTEATFTMLRFLQTFRAIVPADDEPWREKVSVTLSCISGCKLRLWRD